MKKGLFVFILIAAGLAIFSWSCQNNARNMSEVTNPETEPVSLINFDKDVGGEPWVLDVENATLANENYRVVNWTGQYLQLVFMTLKPGEIIDLELHAGTDQFIRIDQGEARVWMGKTENNLDFDKTVSDNWAILIPAGYWHKVENIGTTDLKVYTLYGPPNHSAGTIHKTYNDAAESHEDEH